MALCLCVWVGIVLMSLVPSVLEWSWMKSWNSPVVRCLSWVRTPWGHQSDRECGSLHSCSPPLAGAYWLQLWRDLAVEQLQEFLHSFGLWRLHPQECEMSTHDVRRVASWPEHAEVLIRITFRKLLSVNRLSRNTQITHLHFAGVEQLCQGKESGGLEMS